MPDEQYVRLTRPRVRRQGFLTVTSVPRSSLWLGSDHLLNVDNTRFAERYKRFYFRDIQAITICETKRHRTWNFVLLILLISCLGGLVSSFPALGSRSLWAILLFILFTFLIANNVLGPACAVYLRTAVQTEELPSLNRIRRARRVLGRIRPLIAAAQGQIAADEVAYPRTTVVTGPLNLSAHSGDQPR